MFKEAKAEGRALLGAVKGSPKTVSDSTHTPAERGRGTGRETRAQDPWRDGGGGRQGRRRDKVLLLLQRQRGGSTRAITLSGMSKGKHQKEGKRAQKEAEDSWHQVALELADTRLQGSTVSWGSEGG